MKQLQGELERREQVRLHDLQVKLMAAIEANPVLRQFKQQIRIDSTLTGLRIEIVDYAEAADVRDRDKTWSSRTCATSCAKSATR